MFWWVVVGFLWVLFFVVVFCFKALGFLLDVVLCLFVVVGFWGGISVLCDFFDFFYREKAKNKLFLLFLLSF